MEVPNWSPNHQSFAIQCWSKYNEPTHKSSFGCGKHCKSFPNHPKSTSNQPTCAALFPCQSGIDRTGGRCSSTFEACPAKSDGILTIILGMWGWMGLMSKWPINLGQIWNSRILGLIILMNMTSVSEFVVVRHAVWNLEFGGAFNPIATNCCCSNDC